MILLQFISCSVSWNTNVINVAAAFFLININGDARSVNFNTNSRCTYSIFCLLGNKFTLCALQEITLIKIFASDKEGFLIRNPSIS